MRRLPAVATVAIFAAAAALVVGGVAGATSSPAAGDPGHGASVGGLDGDALAADGVVTDASGSQDEPDGGSATDAESRAAVISGQRVVHPCAATPPSDRGSPDGGDAIGWEDGVWYDEAIEAENAASLTPAERDAVVARTAARVEALRCLEFASLPPIEVVNRSTMTARQRDSLANQSAASESLDDARLEAALLLGTTEDPVAARARATGGAARASYDSDEGRISLLATDDAATAVENATAAGDETANATGIAIDEVTLAHELVHALQDQRFGLASFDGQRIDEELGETGLVEGDAALIEHWYDDRCGENGWDASCVRTEFPTPQSSGNLALELLQFQPYNDGPGFVEHAFEAGGWPAVDERYDRPPTSAYQVLYPNSYDSYERSFVHVNVTMARGWERIRPPDAPANDVLGPGAISSAMLAPTFERGGDEIYSPESIQHSGGRANLGPYEVYDYSVDAVRGWRSDRLIAYWNNQGQLASIWGSEWSSATDAERFEQRYTTLLGIRGAEPIDGLGGTYRFEASSSYDGVVYVTTLGDRVVVVHAPNVEALRTLYAGAAPQSGGGFEGPDVGSAAAPDVQADQLSGLTAVVAVLVLVAVALAVRRSERGS